MISHCPIRRIIKNNARPGPAKEPGTTRRAAHGRKRDVPIKFFVSFVPFVVNFTGFY